jgi:glutamate N-acetyltransferase/amino-acid N-acetyltransferase
VSVSRTERPGGGEEAGSEAGPGRLTPDASRAGAVCAPAGFVAAGLSCGIKASGARDLALVAAEPGPLSGRPPGASGRCVPAAAVFTVNKAAAAPVRVSRDHLHETGGWAAGVVLNSGNANAATGEPGMLAARRTAALAARHLGSTEQEVLVCSTGLIGVPLAADRLEAAIPALVAGAEATPERAEEAAAAILTTDTRPRQAVVRGPSFVVGGMAKGAAMLSPHLATMLAILTTDALLTPSQLDQALRAAVAHSFNELSVDGCCSTNDTVVALASGRAGRADPEVVSEAMVAACRDLSQQMAADAEGATRVARITVLRAADDAEAARAARRVAESQLVQCSLHGADPYWGRVVSELGSAGVEFVLEQVTLRYGQVTVCRGGAPAPISPAERDALAAHLAGPLVEVVADLGLGPGRAEVLTTDLSPAYIAENMRTS